MLLRRSWLAALVLAVVAGCADHASAPPQPTSIRLIAGDEQTGIVGQRLSVSPIFAVEDENGARLTGVAVRVTVQSGGGQLSGAPTRTTEGSTTVGSWTLGPATGVNQLKVEVDGLTPLVITANALAGAAAKIIATSPALVSGRVGTALASLPEARVADAFDNPLPGARVSVTLVGGGTATTSLLVADENGRVAIGAWTLGTVAGQQTLTLTSGSASTSFVADALPDDPVRLVVVSGDAQRGLAGSSPPQPIVLRVIDKYGNGVSAQDASLGVTAGGGSLSASLLKSATDGTITISSWRLGRSVTPQSLHVIAGPFTADLTARIQSDYDIDVRFFGPAMTDAQKDLFTNAAARIRAVVTGDIPDITVSNLNIAAACGMSDLPTLNGPIDDVIIYASVRDIDGSGGVLAQSGPCVFRPAGQKSLTAVGVMEFDAADIARLGAQGNLQEVITHEMLHVIGVGTLWSVQSLVRGENTSAVAYYGAEGLRGCVDDGGTSVCATNVPVENIGGPGTVGSHWRESTFRAELMTGYVSVGGMPLSHITVGSLADIGYVVNPFAADPYQVPSGASAATTTSIPSTAWEMAPPGSVVLDANGNATVLKRP